MQARTEIGVLPADHPQRSGAQFGRVISLVESGSNAEAAALLQGELAEDAAAELYAGGWCRLCAFGTLVLQDC